MPGFYEKLTQNSKVLIVSILLVTIAGGVILTTSRDDSDAQTVASIQQMKAALEPIGTVSTNKAVIGVADSVIALESLADAAVLSVDNIKLSELGEATYQSSCAVCHETGAANAPILIDKLAWTVRLEVGVSALHRAAMQGKGSMPAKGGNTALSEQEVIEAVNYMIVKSQ